MAIVRVTTVEKFAGESTDSKPAATYPMSEFYEFDTGQNYLWNGSEWVEDLRLLQILSQALD